MGDRIRIAFFVKIVFLGEMGVARQVVLLAKSLKMEFARAAQQAQIAVVVRVRQQTAWDVKAYCFCWRVFVFQIVVQINTLM